MKVYREGGIPSDRLVVHGFELRDQLIAAGPCLASCEIIRRPTRKRVLVEDVRPTMVAGAEQSWLVCASTVFDLGRNEMVMVEVSAHIAISQHALARLFERGQFAITDVMSLVDTATLWVVPLLQVMDRTGFKVGTNVSIPFMDGLLLGTLEANHIEPEQGPTAATISREKVLAEYLSPAFGTLGKGIMVIGMNTYVGARELFENQQELLRTFQQFERTFGPEMQMLRSGMIKGLPDSRMVARFGEVLTSLSSEQLENLSMTLERFFGTPEWKTHAEAHRRPKKFLH